jgi:CRISPR-associated endonuclease Cas1
MREKWKIIGGFGAHIKSNRDNLIIHYKGLVTEIPINDLSHVLIIGGHNLNTSTISTLINQGIFISFCESDGEPVGFIAPYDYNSYKEIQQFQEKALPYSYAFTCAKASIDARLLAIEHYAEITPETILFSGELEIIKGYAEELKNLVKIDELRRIEKLVHDMYYEIISRLISPSYKFNRRSKRPYQDPVNAILSFGYGMLLSACKKSLIAGHLNPSKGFLNQGNNALINDLISGWKPEIIDKCSIEFINKGGLPQGSYDINTDRCILSENIINELIPLFQNSIDQNIIDLQIQLLIQALRNEKPFEVIRLH